MLLDHPRPRIYSDVVGAVVSIPSLLSVLRNPLGASFANPYLLQFHGCVLVPICRSFGKDKCLSELEQRHEFCGDSDVTEVQSDCCNIRPLMVLPTAEARRKYRILDALSLALRIEHCPLTHVS